MAAIIADQLGVSPSAVYVDDKGQEGDCTSVRVYLTGLTANDMLDKFDPQFLGEFAEADACGDTGIEDMEKEQYYSKHSFLWLYTELEPV